MNTTPAEKVEAYRREIRVAAEAGDARRTRMLTRLLNLWTRRNTPTDSQTNPPTPPNTP